MRLTSATSGTTRTSSKPALSRRDRYSANGPLASIGGDEHVQIHPLARRRGVTRRDHPLDQQQLACGRDRAANVAQDRDSLLVLPVVDQRLENVQVAILRNALEEAATNKAAPILDRR